MTGKVFISCGQKDPEEIAIANKLKQWLNKRGFNAYVAKIAQSIQDVNSGIINELKNSDFYIFIDFHREKIKQEKRKPIYRGSLFTNQELALVYYLNFEKTLFFQQAGIKSEGLLRYIAANPTPFEKKDDVLALIKKEIKKRPDWTPSYTRHLIPANLNWGVPVIFQDHVGNRFDCRALQIDIQNKRNDIAAQNTVARLEFIESQGKKIPCGDRSMLKVTGHPGFSQVIWPENHGAFDLFLMDRNNPSHMYLNSALDLRPKNPIISQNGVYYLYYAILAENFPLLKFKVKIDIQGDFNNTKIVLL